MSTRDLYRLRKEFPPETIFESISWRYWNKPRRRDGKGNFVRSLVREILIGKRMINEIISVLYWLIKPVVNTFFGYWIERITSMISDVNGAIYYHHNVYETLKAKPRSVGVFERVWRPGLWSITVNGNSVTCTLPRAIVFSKCFLRTAKTLNLFLKIRN